MISFTLAFRVAEIEASVEMVDVGMAGMADIDVVADTVGSAAYAEETMEILA